MSEQENLNSAKTQKPVNWCIFENRLCKFAVNTNGAFECKAPSDEEMTCH